MVMMSVRFSQKLSFSGQVAECEIQAVNKQFGIKRTFLGATFKEALDKFEKDGIHIY